MQKRSPEVNPLVANCLSPNEEFASNNGLVDRIQSDFPHSPSVVYVKDQKSPGPSTKVFKKLEYENMQEDPNKTPPGFYGGMDRELTGRCMNG